MKILFLGEKNKKNYNNELIFDAFWKINEIILSSIDFDNLAKNIVNVIVKELDRLNWGYRISVLTLFDEKRKIVKRISFSPTAEALEILQEAKVRFEEIEIPISTKENLLVKAIKNKKTYITNDLSDVFFPEKTRDVWRDLQKQVGIKTSIVIPLILEGKAIGAMIFSLSRRENEITDFEKRILSIFSNSVALAIDKINNYRKITAANEKLKELDKLKDEFLNVAAHELRAPMTAVKGYLSMIEEEYKTNMPNDVKDFVDGALEGTDREIRLVNNMLNVSRIEEKRLVFNMGNINLTEVIKKVYDEFKIEAKNKNLQFDFKIKKLTKDKVYADLDRIHEVVANFVSNAIKYTDKGEVKIEVNNPSKGVVRVEIKDTGLGMTKEEVSKLFSKFYRAESSAGKVLGTGLGLYITKLLVEKFGGQLGVESEKGKGSTFWFELPVVK